MNMSKTKALKLAKLAHSDVSWRGFNWGFSYPFYFIESELNGPRGVREGQSYRDAIQKRADSVAQLALCLMGVSSEDVDWYYHGSDFDGSAKERLNAYLAKYPSILQTS
jgi:hypothetical protein